MALVYNGWWANPPNGRELTASVGASLVWGLINSSFTRSTEFTVSILRTRTRKAAEPLTEPDRPAARANQRFYALWS